MSLHQEAVKFSNLTANSSVFQLTLGGLYMLEVIATFGAGNVVLQVLGPDNLTFLSVSNQITANGGQTLYLPPGQYKFVLNGGATAAFVALVRISIE